MIQYNGSYLYIDVLISRYLTNISQIKVSHQVLIIVTIQYTHRMK
ncbi:uncharacterized protein METZ01_LOCUS466442 [marine metagenome]|uniref:Uncharacterized protein n=1 Tax=marine metagenome TaxID=408172 RepID=A0A383B2F4_9ZZZZ